MKKLNLISVAIASIVFINSCSQKNNDEGQNNSINYSTDSISKVKSDDNIKPMTSTGVVINDSISNAPPPKQMVNEKMKVQPPNTVSNTTTTNNTTTSSNTSNVTGVIEGDCINGAGKYIFDNGDKFNGYWKDGIRNDYGRYDYKNGDWYIGDFKSDKIEGKGVFHLASGKSISGEWVNYELIKVDKPEDSPSLHMKLPQMQMKK